MIFQRYITVFSLNWTNLDKFVEYQRYMYASDLKFNYFDNCIRYNTEMYQFFFILDQFG